MVSHSSFVAVESLFGSLYFQKTLRLILWVLRSYDEVEPIILAVDEDAEVNVDHDINNDIARIDNDTAHALLSA